MKKILSLVLAVMMIAVVGLAGAAQINGGNTSNAPTLATSNDTGVAGTWIEPDTESVDFVSVLISLMTFAREQFGDDITLDKISCGKQEEKAEIGFYKNGQLYYLGFYAIAEGEEE